MLYPQTSFWFILAGWSGALFLPCAAWADSAAEKSKAWEHPPSWQGSGTQGEARWGTPSWGGWEEEPALEESRAWGYPPSWRGIGTQEEEREDTPSWGTWKEREEEPAAKREETSPFPLSLFYASALLVPAGGAGLLLYLAAQRRERGNLGAFRKEEALSAEERPAETPPEVPAVPLWETEELLQTIYEEKPASKAPLPASASTGKKGALQLTTRAHKEKYIALLQEVLKVYQHSLHPQREVYLNQLAQIATRAALQERECRFSFEEGHTLLEQACLEGAQIAVKTLLPAAAKDKQRGGALLQLACRGLQQSGNEKKYLPVLQALLTHYPEQLNAPLFPRGTTLFHHTCQKGYASLADFLR